MKVIAADSGAAILNSRFEPLQVVAAAAVLVEPPYRRADRCLVEPIFAPAEDGHTLIVHELEMCQELMRETGADVVHLDLSVGGLAVEDISPAQLRGRARSRILAILPHIRKLATNIKRIYGIDVLAIGKESVPVRVAELTAGAHAILHACRKAIDENEEVTLGLPSKCYSRLTRDGVTLHSLIPAEHDVTGYAGDQLELLKEVDVCELLNPCARGFRALKIVLKRE